MNKTIKSMEPRYLQPSVAGKSVDLPAPECLMVKELEENTLERISGVLEYTDYKALAKEENK